MKKEHKIKLRSTKSHHFYTTTKNRKNKPDKLKLRKFDPVIREYAEYVEDKIK